jgi:hypothetical protein
MAKKKTATVYGGSIMITKYSRELCLIGLFASLSFAGYLYSMSLQGGTFAWMKDHVVELGIYLFSSLFIYLISFNVILFTKYLSRIVKAVLIVIWVLFVYMLYKWDNDDGMDHHGYFNIVAYCIAIGYIEIFILATYSVLKVWTSVSWKMKKVLLVMGGVGLLASGLKFTMWYTGRQVQFRSGLFGQSLAPAGESTSICHLDDTPIAWMDIIPPYVQNFWAGRWWCGGLSSPPEILFEDHTMKIYCSNSKDVHVEILPSTIGWTLEMKSRIQKHMLRLKTSKNLKVSSRNQPVILDLNEEGVTPHEVFRVTCGKEFYEPNSKIVFYPRRKPEVVERSRKILKEKKPEQEPLNVVIMFLDAVSRKHFQRKFPQTVAVMESLYKDYKTTKDPKSTGIFQFFRYHALDFSTDDNTKALYLGRTVKGTEPELVHERFANASVAPPIWFNYRDNGYVTVRIDNFCEDWPQKYNKFLADADQDVITPFCLPEYLGSAHDILYGPYGLTHRCLSGKNVHTYSFDYIDKFWNTYSDVPKFLTSAFIEGHEITGDIIEDVDADMAKFITRFKKEGHLDNTILLIMSDHGLHSGLPPIFTESGRIEHFNPLQFWFIPNHILNKYESSGMRENLVTNSQRLVTAFDIHETLKHILDLTHEPPPAKPLQYGESLFTDRISPMRTCSSVKVPMQWCKCHPKL